MADTQTIDLAAIRQRQRQTWATGDFADLATTNTILGELLGEAVDNARRRAEYWQSLCANYRPQVEAAVPV